MRDKLNILVFISLILMTGAFLSSNQVYSATTNGTEGAINITGNQPIDTAPKDPIKLIETQNSDGKLDAQIVPYSNASKVIKNGTLTVKGSNIPITYEQVGPLAILDKDMILASEVANGKAALDRFIDADPWTNGIIPVVINSDIPNPERIIDAMSYVQSVTPIRFEPVDVNENGQILNSNYLRFLESPATDDSCYTFAGMLSPTHPLFTNTEQPFYRDSKYHGQPIMVASWCDKGSLVHELGHDLGLWHEQKRCDRDQYIEIIWSNIQQDARSQYSTLCDPDQPSKSPASFGTYDYCSIMHYKRFSGFAVDRDKPVYNIKQSVVGCEEDDIGKSEVYSPTDIQAIKSVYAFVR